MSRFNLDQTALLGNLTMRVWSGTRNDKKVAKEIRERHRAKSDDVGRFIKHLIDPHSLKPIRKTRGQARFEFDFYTLPWTGSGKIIPVKMMDECEAAIGGYQERFEDQVSEFLFDYPRLVEEARDSLGTLFDVNDYPQPHEMPNKFKFKLKFFPIPNEDDFRVDLRDDQLVRIKTSLSEDLETAASDAMRAVWRRLHDKLSHMASTLKDPEKIFRDSLVQNLADLCLILDAMNLAGDQELTAARRKIESELIVPPETLRGEDGLEERKRVQKGSEEMLDDVVLEKMAFYTGTAS